MWAYAASVLLLFTTIEGARILGLFIMPSISHQIVYQPIWKELALRGHQMTVLSPNILRENISNLREIDTGYTYDIMNNVNVEQAFSRRRNIFARGKALFDHVGELTEAAIRHPEFQDIINGSDDQFDVILIEPTIPLSFAVAAKFKVPTIAIYSLGALLHHHDLIGNPSHPIVSPNVVSGVGGDLDFFGRLRSFLFNIFYRAVYYSYILPRLDAVARKYFGNDMPYLGELERNVSLLILNSNPITYPIRPNVPAIIEISQVHIKSNKTLPMDLKKCLDDATQGVVYFSLGSNVKSANVTPEIHQVFMQTLRELPYKVLLKWESGNLTGKPDNVIVRNWWPQQDILAHPNVKVFITQGGIQSIEEAVTNEVPMVVIPFYVDQPHNAKRVESLGIGRSVDFLTIAKDEFKATVLDVAENTKYKENIREARSVLVDQPMRGVEKAVWWIEYVIRHKGAKHLVNPARDMPFWMYFCLDVIGAILLVMISIAFVIYKVAICIIAKTTLKIKTE